MEDLIARVVENLLGRIGGPMSFRLVCQPLMALGFAARAGIRDAKAGRPPYFWTLFTAAPGHRWELLRDGWKDVGQIFLLAAVLDAIYQIITVRWIYPVELLIVAFTLAFIPYLLFRGIFTRLARLVLQRGR
ncbi:MAG: hypothetical protein ND807_05320 [Vicinamibacterales bacterium]|nr:hypothetical protein [Vicinamibacterales bacterium]